MKEKTKNLIFIIIIIGILMSIFIEINYANEFLTRKIVPKNRDRIVFRNILVEDDYNSTFHLDVIFDTDESEFLVEEKIHVHASLDRIHNNSIYPFSSVYFSIVTSDGNQMPFQDSYMLGEVMEKYQTDYYMIEYNTYLNLSSKYSCRLILKYFNTTNISLLKFEEDEIVIGPLLEVYSSSVALQINMNLLQEEANNRTIGLALIIVILTLITILITWITKYNELLFRLESYFSQHIKGKNVKKDNGLDNKRKKQNLRKWKKHPAFKKYK